MVIELLLSIGLLLLYSVGDARPNCSPRVSHNVPRCVFSCVWLGVACFVRAEIELPRTTGRVYYRVQSRLLNNVQQQ